MYFPLKVHSHFSLSVGLSMPRHIVRRCTEIGVDGVAVTDINSISGSIDIISAMKKKDKKPIMGLEITVVKDYNEKYKDSSRVVLIAKNYKGWITLAKIVSESNKHYYYEKPHITIEDIARLNTDNSIFVLSGWLGSTIGDRIFSSPKEIYLANSYESAKAGVNKDWYPEICNIVSKYKEYFGPDNFYLGLELNDINFVHANKLVSEGLRYVSRKTDTKLVALPNSYYAHQEDAYDQRVLLVNKLDTNLKDISKKTVYGEDIELGKFFTNINYHIPTYEEMVSYGHTEQELINSLEIASQCEVYSLENKPMLPQFKIPTGESSKEYLSKLCDIGWSKRWPLISSVIKRTKHTEEEYRNRLSTELEVLTSVGLSDYFLIVKDVIDFAVNDGQLTGAGRGSAAGSLVLYLLGVTHIDPIEYDLLFERFYNAGRNTKDNVSLPDVDMDFEKNGREKILHYIREKYGHDRVAQMITFNRMQGRGAIKDVVRAHGALDIETVNKITKNLPNEPEIADQLEILKEADKQAGGDGVASIIEWALENQGDHYKEWVHYDDKGNLQGPLSKIFEQAIRMEGTKRASGKHAAGIVISQQPLAEICPMVYDSSTGEMIAAIEMAGLEQMGQVKFDFLGISTLDKLHVSLNHLRTGRLYL